MTDTETADTRAEDTTRIDEATEAAYARGYSAGFQAGRDAAMRDLGQEAIDEAIAAAESVVGESLRANAEATT